MDEVMQFDPMKIKLKDLRVVEREFGVKMMKLLGSMRKGDGVDIDDLDINELQAMVYISLAASGKNPTADSVGDLSLGEMVELLVTMEGENEVETPTIS